jgi:hypothetical protein
MFYRVLGAACAISLTFASVAQAADPQTIVYSDGTAATQHRVSVAAKSLCEKAVSKDEAEYGSYEECVADARQNAHPAGDSAQNVAAK